ncbi:ephrin type-B receptor 5-like isoform X2 [Eublepharis macularius]|uniref:Ephrin type-B receptor 5-like isoform X2 n=1 Tax=Eublepharis macularius TaxID=481883 RepID=A0AA97JBZ1_EUBMA|nr:ephrin type-B receptor 5-like isoform X2 [Eublepharis macularius]XP_054838102.1 ephrin type-B receptor 5-like isoform X2 [Eublepharis macularius]
MTSFPQRRRTLHATACPFRTGVLWGVEASLYCYLYCLLQILGAFWKRLESEDEDNSFMVTSETNMATISSLSPGKIYAFQVRARTAVGYGPYSGKMYFQTLVGTQ